MADVFISYARSSEAKARAAAHALEAAGLDIWWDEQLPTHRAYYEVIEERLREASAVLVLWSEEAAKSQWVRAEADLARSMGKLVQASVDGSLPPMPFNQIQCAHLKDWKGAAGNSEWRKVLASIEALTGAAAGPAPADAPLLGPERRKPIWRNPFVLAATGLALAVALGVFAYEALTPLGGAKPAKSEAASVAVLPFESASGDAAGQAFAAALTDDLGGVLSENNLRPLSQEQARTLNGPDRMARLKTLGATFALTGSVRREDGLIKVRVTFLDVSSNTVLWSEAFERKEADAAFLREWIAARSSAIAEMALRSTQGALHTPDADILALSITSNLATASPDPMQAAVGLRAAEQVVARAPNFAGGRASYALGLMFAGIGGPPAEAPALFAKARKEAEAAIRLDPLQSEGAYGVLYALSRSQPQVSLVKSEDILLGAQKVSPSFPFLMMTHCRLLLDAGRVREAMSQCQRAKAIHPLVALFANELAMALLADGQDQLARRTVDKVWRENPVDPEVRNHRLILNLLADDPALVEAILQNPEQRPQSMDPATVAALRGFLAARRSGAAGEIDRALAQLTAAVANRRLEPTVLVLAATDLGRLDAAFAALDNINWNGLRPLPVAMIPQTASLRRDERFWPWAKKVGLVDYWKARGVLPDFCSDPAAGVDCKAAMAKL